MTKTQKIIIVVLVGLALTVSLEATVDKPRGIRNNNPGNLRPLDSGNWDGQSGVDSGNYITFSTSAWGLRALAHNLYSYGANDGINTLSATANRWAPASENDPNAYAATLSSVSGLGVSDTIDLTDKATNLAVMRGIVQAENGEEMPGVPWFSDAELSQAQGLGTLPEGW